MWFTLYPCFSIREQKTFQGLHMFYILVWIPKQHSNIVVFFKARHLRGFGGENVCYVLCAPQSSYFENLMPRTTVVRDGASLTGNTQTTLRVWRLKDNLSRHSLCSTLFWDGASGWSPLHIPGYLPCKLWRNFPDSTSQLLMGAQRKVTDAWALAPGFHICLGETELRFSGLPRKHFTHCVIFPGKDLFVWMD